MAEADGFLPRAAARGFCVYLKALEINGFKSFADRTRLVFEPGMVAIVGPNGCGKSNVSDAIRWVLGEQRPTALRCAKMQDVVFSGTDARKPLGLAEVSITFADCEGVLATEFNEVTVTRRVFRSGEGHYFLNKTPCRLRDIQRLFMGTGIGTTSYSVMAQGQIDVILSSKPEDRRGIFEEAAGITKFKADRKEALHKLEQTDANLLRLADVIREVKRQIGSLQRQAGKAQKYRELRDRLRGLDLFVTRRRLAAADVRIRDLDAETLALAAQLASRQTAVAEAEKGTAAIHAEILGVEHRIGELTQAAAQADNQFVRAQEVIRVNEQRIAEYRAWAERDTREAAATRGQIEALTAQQADLARRLAALAERRTATEQALAAADRRFEEHRAAVDAARADVQRLREDAVERERRAAAIQNQLAEMETRQRESLLRRERLAAEHGQLGRALEQADRTHAEVRLQAETRGRDAAGCVERLAAAESAHAAAAAEVRAAQEETARIQAQIAARRAQLDLLADRDETAGDLPEGSRQLLDPANPLRIDRAAVVGTLADELSVPAELRLAVEAALRPWIDAVVVAGPAEARALVGALLQSGRSRAARLVVAGGPAPAAAPAAPAGLEPLLARVRPAAAFADAARRLLGHVFLAETLDAVPDPLPAGCTVVTRQGTVFHADGCVEVWAPGHAVSSPLARRVLIDDGTAQLAAFEAELAAVRARAADAAGRAETLAAAIAEARRVADEHRLQAAQKEGELQTVAREAGQARQRLEIVAHELQALHASTEGDDSRKQESAAELQQLVSSRAGLVDAIAARSEQLRDLESRFGAVTTEATEARIQASAATQQTEHMQAQADAVAVRLAELGRTLEGRNQGVQSYEDGIRRLTAENAGLTGGLDGMRQEAERLHAEVEAARQSRAARTADLEAAEAELAGQRQTLEAGRSRKAQADVELAEARMRRQNQLDRIQNEYGLAPAQLVAEPDQAWPDGRAPALEEADASIAELHNAIQAMGPVNLVAIEEYKELEERHAFLRAQEADLVKSREQILDLIRMINKKTSEMFQATFAQANANFEKMFAKLFGGGTARLVLLEDNEDPLECGVDIVARPPGKRPQTISLLSGGERTMTAVSLLFAIYMIKPAPFCMLDELDAALDDSNIGRFVNQLKEFLVHSQFLIITHNHQTIASADIVYGVTMPEKGISRIVSMRLKEIGVRELGLEAEAGESAEPTESPPSMESPPPPPAP